MRLTALLLVVFTCVQCAGSSMLSDDEMNKLDAALQHLVEHEGATTGPFQYHIAEREDGTEVFGVILRTHDSEALREAGLPVGSVLNEIVTARLSLEEIKQAARLNAVWGIRNSEQNAVPQAPGPESSLPN